MIQISEKKLFRLIKELKEYKQLLPTDNKKFLLQRHKLNNYIELFNKILDAKGFDKFISDINEKRINWQTKKAIMEVCDDE